MDAEPGDGQVDALLTATRAAFAGALARADAACAAAVYTDDARLVPPDAEPFRGREAITAFWQAGIDSGISRVELDPRAVERAAGVAYEIGRYALHLRPADGAPIVDRGTYIYVHERQESGAWRRAVEMFGPDDPPAAD